MNCFTSRTCGLLLLGAALGACSGSGAAPAPAAGVPRPAMTYVSSVVPPGAACPNGGVQLFSGFDDNGNGVLEVSEIDATEQVCNGLPGLDGRASLVKVTPEPAGQRCAAEGLRFDQGLDDDRDGILDAAEIDSTSYVCNGRVGVVAGTLVTSTPLPPGATCPNGGFLIQSGSDADADGVLDPGEVTTSGPVCNGTAGTTQTASLVRVVAEPAGGHCSQGGLVIQTGLDDNGNGALELAEVDSSEYLCNGAAGTTEGGVAALPLVLTNGMGAVSGTLQRGDRELPDGSRAAFYTLSLSEPGVLEVTSIPTGSVEFHLFSSAALATPDLANWGPASLGRAAPRIRLAAGSYVLLVRDAKEALPWTRNDYQALLRFVARPGLLPATIAEHLRQGKALLDSLLTTKATDDFLGAVEHFTAAAALVGSDPTATAADLDLARFYGAAARIAVLAQPYSDEVPDNGLRDLGDLLDAFGYGGTPFERSSGETIRLVKCVDTDPWVSNPMSSLARVASNQIKVRYRCSLQTLPVGSPRAQELQQFLRDQLVPSLRVAHTLLDGVSPGFNAQLSFPKMTRPVEVDRTDVLALKAGVQAALFALLYEHAYDVDVDLVELQANRRVVDASGRRLYGLSEFLEDHPFFLRLKDAATLPESKAALLAVIQTTSAAIDSLLAETDDQSDDLVRVARETCTWDPVTYLYSCTTAYNPVEDLNKAKGYLADAAAVLTAEGPRTVARNLPGETFSVTVDSTRFFGGLDVRGLLPPPRGGGVNGDRPGLFPDPTFGGVMVAYPGNVNVNVDLDQDGSLDFLGGYTKLFDGYFRWASFQAPPQLAARAGWSQSIWDFPLNFDSGVKTFTLYGGGQSYYGAWSVSNGLLTLTFAGPGPGGVQTITAVATDVFTELDYSYSGPYYGQPNGSVPSRFEYFSAGGALIGSEEAVWRRR